MFLKIARKLPNNQGADYGRCYKGAIKARFGKALFATMHKG